MECQVCRIVASVWVCAIPPPFTLLGSSKQWWTWKGGVILRERSHLPLPCQYHYQGSQGFWRREMGWDFNWLLTFPGSGALSQVPDDLYRPANWAAEPGCFPEALWESGEKGELWCVPDAFIPGFIISVFPVSGIWGTPGVERLCAVSWFTLFPETPKRYLLTFLLPRVLKFLFTTLSTVIDTCNLIQ